MKNYQQHKTSIETGNARSLVVTSAFAGFPFLNGGCMPTLAVSRICASINDGNQKTTGKIHMSCFNIVVSRHPLSGSLTQMLIQHITKHLGVWAASIADANFRINTIGDLIYLQTNSSVLLEMYVRYEQAFVDYMISDELQAADEAYMWLESAA